ncbi:hypothetical protein AYO21_11334 [Fonsecaea monophora]|uniref:Uncharacterized protein n=1 Tax=Fonsecaea monophora TaxID=254056 RepID=A0A177ETW8_9EURO|nr:hypothetical protein AYO21_11334 [Fonsecaea monophora]KAH0831535.1 putative Zn(II)2Cys6 transcription factor (Eurofung) [Fonsecaea pedrosoi]OAG34512.1 hypothetical protein AYO21_11334 [Fonsecaea monophora]
MRTKQPLVLSFMPSPSSKLQMLPLKELFNVQLSSLGVFYQINDIFMIGPSFAQDFHRILRKCSSTSRAVRDGFRAIFTALIWSRHRAASWSDIDISRGSLALERLRNAQPSTLEEAISIAVLGPTIAAFDCLTMCSGALLVLRHSLSLIKPWYSQMSQDAELDPILISPILWDTVNCLVTGDVPVLEYRFRNLYLVDRVAGMCTTLMPMLYQLCLLGHKIRDSTVEDHFQSLRTLQRRLTLWSPVLQQESPGRLTGDDISAMVSQALMYRSASLLVIHRLSNPLGTADATGKELADGIIGLLQNYLTQRGPESKLQHVNFPVFLAMLETTEVPKAIFKVLTVLSVTSITELKLKSVIDRVWEQRTKGYSGMLYDLLRSGTDFVVVP